MEEIQVSSLPLKDVLNDIARHWNIDVLDSCQEFSLNLPPAVGEGEIRGINFDTGLGILIYNCKFKHDLKIKFNIDDVHPLKYLYSMKGNIQHCFEQEPDMHNIEQYQSVMVASSGHNGHELKFQKDKLTTIISLEINRNQFSERMLCELDGLNDDLKALFTDYRAKRKFYHEGFYSLKFQELFEAMNAFEGKRLIRKLFLESKASEIFVNQIVQYNDDMQDDSESQILRRGEIKLLEKAVQVIEDNIQGGLTVEKISREVGLNANKLQQGFQYFYKKSVNHYVNDHRMELAIEYLLKTEMTISEICDKIGISSRSYFSKKFKERYHLKPSELRKK